MSQAHDTVLSYRGCNGVDFPKRTVISRLAIRRPGQRPSGSEHRPVAFCSCFASAIWRSVCASFKPIAALAESLLLLALIDTFS
jgi:hypothetical protein